MSDTKNIQIGKNVIQIEAQAVSAIADRINQQFETAVNTILDCKGRLIVLGIGKSGLISQNQDIFKTSTFDIFKTSLFLK